jgi:predicted phage terminase large subunit-like protein
MTNWNEVLDFLQPKMPPFCPEEPSLTQKAFLRTYSLEALFGGSAGGGKMLSLYSDIPTPRGFVKMGDIKPGDFIFGRDGKPHLVLAESDIEVVNGYKLTFDDGSTVDAHDDHLWLTYSASELAALTRRTDEYRARRRAKRPSRAKGSQGEYKSLAVAERNSIYRAETLEAPTGTVRTTAEIVATLLTPRGRRNHAIPVSAPIKLMPKDLLVDPYVLGAWLGDGSSDSGVITSMDDSIIDSIEQYGYTIKSIHTKPSNKASMFNFDRLRQDLKKLGVLNNKHIPHDYLWSSEDQRVALLQGLMDTDGTVAKNSGSAEFCNTNKAIVDGLAFIVRSLGMKATIREGRAKLNGKDYGPKWTVKFVANRPVFRLERKLSSQKIASRRTTQFRYIVSAERIGPLPMKCIRVSSPDSLYLVSDNFIPTHNSSALLMAALQYVDVPNYSAIIFRRTYADLALPGAIMDRFINWVAPHEDVRWNANNYTAMFPSGARISFGYLNNQQDYLRYKGAEFQFVGMDEVTEIRESDYRYMFSRLRRPASGPLSQVPLRMRSACNPAPNWVRQRFIVEGKEQGRIFVPSKLTDNPGIDADSYRAALQALDPIERKRLEEGDWWATALGTMFDRSNLVIIDQHEIPKISTSARAVRFWDLAATEPSHSNPDPDWTVGTLMLFDQGKAYILDVRKARVKGDKVEQLIAQTAYEDGHTVPVRMEQEPGSSGKALVDQYARYVLPGYDFKGVRSTGDKVTRARPFAAAVANGNVHLLRGPWLTDWLDEISSFPESCPHDDQIDSAVGAFTHLTGLGLPQRKRVGIIV